MTIFDVDEGGPYDDDTPPGRVPGVPLDDPAERPHKCPCCDGTGLVSRPPGVAGDVVSWPSSGTATYSCRACSGTGVLWR